MSKGYVLMYGNLSSIGISNIDDLGFTVFGSFNYTFGQGYEIDEYVNTSDGINEDSLYNYYSAIYGDISYYQTIAINSCDDSDNRHEFFAQSLININIISNADYDDNHLSGTSLNDLIWIASYSPIKYIQSGYNDVFDWSKMSLLSNNFKKLMLPFGFNYVNWQIKYMFPVDKLLSDVTNDDLILLKSDAGSLLYNCGIFNFLFISEPTLLQTHTFTLTMTDNEGKTYSATFTKTWE
ncbi:MAG: hypothetical protein LBN95_03760 [Prevotellaceae bacterium]|nr:hypothetical protein [Prevotellaceae bacterium]